MTWSIQLTPWALPPLLAVLLALRDGGFLWTRRRGSGALPLLALAVAVGVWGILDLVAAAATSLPVKLGAARLEYLPSAAAVTAWVWFALAHSGRASSGGWTVLGILGSVLLAVAVAALLPDTAGLLVTDPGGVVMGETVGLVVRHGPLHWVVLTARIGGAAGATWILAAHLAAIPGRRGSTLSAGAAGGVAILPAALHLALAPGAEWADLSSAGFAAASALLVGGVVRSRILHLGPADRDLVLDRLEDPLVVLDGLGRLVDVNEAARRELGLQPYGDVPIALGTLWASGPALSAPLPKVALPEDAPEPRTFEVTVTRLGEDGRSGRTALLLRDVTLRERIQSDLRQALADLERLARTDPLTGLANRRAFMEALSREVDRAERYGHPLSLVLLDLDHFKGVNDTHGHAAGDEVLREAARALRSVCRDVDLAARLGGEELALLLPDTHAAGARTVAERVRERIAGAAHHARDGASFRVTASLGVAARRPGVRAEALLQAADVALYRAKDAGRNQVTMAS